MAYRVIAPCVIAQDQDGHSHHFYGPGGNDPGATIPWLSKDQAEHFLAEGLVEEVGDDEAAAESEDGGPPAKAEPKAAWVDYAVSQGYDHDEVEAMTKADIQGLFD